MEIRKATLSDVTALSDLAIRSFMPAHGHSSPAEDISTYVQSNFSASQLHSKIEDNTNTFFILFDNEKMIGYYKINLNLASSMISSKEVTYMSRLYVLPDYYGKGAGKKLVEHSIDIAKKNKQLGMWLKVWTENHRAIRFYKKQGFEILGEELFKISETHSNPNYVMYLPF